METHSIKVSTILNLSSNDVPKKFDSKLGKVLHFMVEHEIVLGHVISKEEIKVYKVDRCHSQASHTQMCEKYLIFFRTCQILS